MYRTISPCRRKAFSADCIFRKSIRRASSSASFAAECSTSPSICGRGGETYGKWFGVELSAENKKQFYIPQGFAHGFLVLSDEAEFCYKPICTIPKTKAASHGTIPRSASSGRSWSDGMTERRRGKIMPSKTGQRSLCRKKICAGAVWKSTEALRKAIAI